MDAIVSWIQQHMPNLNGLGGLIPQDIGNGQQVWVDPTTGTIIRQYPDGSIASGTPGDVTGSGVTTSPNGTTSENSPSNLLDPNAQSPSTSGGTSGGGMGGFPLDVLKWLGALALLWIILTALSEYSANGAMLGQALAGLILIGALWNLGPTAIKNVNNIWST